MRKTWMMAALLLASAPVFAQSPAAPASNLCVATCASGVCHGVAKPLEGANVLRNEYVT
jgi:hypothetical protein